MDDNDMAKWLKWANETNLVMSVFFEKLPARRHLHVIGRHTGKS